MRKITRVILWLSLSSAVGVAAVAVAQQSFFIKKPESRVLSAYRGPDLLEPDEAFKSKISVAGSNKLIIDVTPASGYYLYKDKIQVTIKESGGASVGAVHFPPSVTKVDKTFGKTEVYHNTATVGVDLVRTPAQKKVTVTTKYQGCNEEIGVCYPPIEKSIDVILP